MQIAQSRVLRAYTASIINPMQQNIIRTARVKLADIKWTKLATVFSLSNQVQAQPISITLVYTWKLGFENVIAINYMLFHVTYSFCAAQKKANNWLPLVKCLKWLPHLLIFWKEGQKVTIVNYFIGENKRRSKLCDTFSYHEGYKGKLELPQE